MANAADFFHIFRLVLHVTVVYVAAKQYRGAKICGLESS
jgi:hypothetical protein